MMMMMVTTFMRAPLSDCFLVESRFAVLSVYAAVACNSSFRRLFHMVRLPKSLEGSFNVFHCLPGVPILRLNLLRLLSA